MLGLGDVDFMDYNISYYTIGTWASGPGSAACTPTRPSRARTTVRAGPGDRAPVISNGGKTYKVTIRTGAMWDTSPARQVTGGRRGARAQAVLQPDPAVRRPAGLRGADRRVRAVLQRASPRSRRPSRQSRTTSTATRSPGVTASGQTITYNLVHPATYFPDMLTLTAFNPTPVESLNYLPASAAAAQHIIADGPYMVAELHADPAASSTSATRRGRRARTRSARPTSTRSRSPRPATSRPSSSSCRPTRRRRAWSSTRSRRSAR